MSLGKTVSRKLSLILCYLCVNVLMLNADKPEVIVLGPKHIRDSLSSNIVNLDGITLASSTTVRNLGVIFDQDLSFNSYVKQISRTAFFHLRNIAKIRHILSQQDAEKLVHTFVTSRLDNCNSLFSGQEVSPTRLCSSKCSHPPNKLTSSPELGLIILQVF